MALSRFRPILRARDAEFASRNLSEIESVWDSAMRDIESYFSESKNSERSLLRLALSSVRALFVSTTQGSSVLLAETNLFSFTVKGWTLSRDLESIQGYAVGRFAATAGNKRVRVYFGATLIFDTGVLAIAAASSWSLSFQIIRTGDATQKCSVHYVSSSAVLIASSSYVASAETMSSDSVLRVTGTGAATGDVLGEMFRGDFVPAI